MSMLSFQTLCGYCVILSFAITGLAIYYYDKERRNKLIERERLQSELEFLKAQINPHFLFNALNSVYVLMDEDKKMASETLLKFCSLLRYQLYECSSKVTILEKEREFILNYIQLEKVRSGERL